MFSSENKPLSVSDFLVYGQRRKPLASEQLHLATFVHDKHCQISHTTPLCGQQRMAVIVETYDISPAFTCGIRIA